MHVIHLLKDVAAIKHAKIGHNFKYKAQLTRVSRNYQKTHKISSLERIVVL